MGEARERLRLGAGADCPLGLERPREDDGAGAGQRRADGQVARGGADEVERAAEDADLGARSAEQP